MDDYDREKVHEMFLALMQLTLHDFSHAWKGFAWDTLDRLYEKGWIENPRGKAKSVQLIEEGLAAPARLFRHHLVYQTKHKTSCRIITERARDVTAVRQPATEMDNCPQ